MDRKRGKEKDRYIDRKRERERERGGSLAGRQNQVFIFLFCCRFGFRTAGQPASSASARKFSHCDVIKIDFD